MPARCELPVAGVFDLQADAARATARTLRDRDRLPHAALRQRRRRDVIFDLAVPGDQILGILEQLPRGAAVLIQKPMGPDLETARAIRACCRDRGLTARGQFPAPVQPERRSRFGIC